MRYVHVLWMVALAWAALFGCQPAAPTPAAGAARVAAPASAPARVTASYSAVTADQMVLWVAQEAGIFAKNGIDADLRLVDSTTGVASLLSGETQLAVIGGLQVANAVAEGADLVVLATLTPVYSFKFLVPPSVRSRADLMGQKVGIARLGSSTDAAARAGLRYLGIDPDQDVTLVQIGSYGALESALLNNAVQGAPLQPPTTVKLETQGFHPLFDLAALKLPAAVAVLAGRQSWIDANRDLTQRFVDSLVEATQRERADRAVADAVMRTYLKIDDQEALDATYDYYVKEVHPSAPYATSEQFADIIEQASAKSPQIKTLNVASLIDSSFVRAAEARGLTADKR